MVRAEDEVDKEEVMTRGMVVNLVRETARLLRSEIVNAVCNYLLCLPHQVTGSRRGAGSDM